MKHILRRRPSPALVISCIALFVSLGGVSYGVATGSIGSREIRNNSITTNDLRNGAVRTQDIRNNEIRGFDIRNSSIQGRDIAFDTITGVDISESSLAKVPSAAAADSAASVPALKPIAPVTMAEGATAVTLAASGPLTLSGVCQADGADTDALVRVQSTEPGSAVAGEVDTPSFGPGPVTAATVADAAGGTRTADDRTVVARASSARALSAQLAVTADAAGAGACSFAGFAVFAS